MGIGHQADVDGVSEHILINLVGPAILDVNVHCGEGLKEFLQVGREIMEADAVNRRHTDGAGNDVLDLLQPAVECVIGLDDLLAVVVEHLPFAGETELLLAALDEQ